MRLFFVSSLLHYGGSCWRFPAFNGGFSSASNVCDEFRNMPGEGTLVIRGGGGGCVRFLSRSKNTHKKIPNSIRVQCQHLIPVLNVWAAWG